MKSAVSTQPMQRIFFALWPSSETANEIMAWSRDAHALCGGRMMRVDTLHMTLAFLGNTPAEKVEELVRAAPAWTIPVGPLVLSHFDRFVRPRVVWAGPSHNDQQAIAWLDEAYDTLWTHLENMGWQRPESVFRPHVSLLRQAGLADLAGLHRQPLAWTPKHCFLVASRPGEGGSYYQILAKLPLRHCLDNAS